MKERKYSIKSDSDKRSKWFKELKQDCQIDKTALDEECCSQSFLYAKWSNRLMLAEDKLRKEELELTRYKAKKMLSERKTHKTDKSAECAYRASKDYGTISKNKSDAKKSVDLMQTAVYAMMQRKSMVESLVRLNTSDYYNA